MRRWPHSRFSRARRTTGRVVPGVVGRRPGRRRSEVSYFFATSLRCHASSVAGQMGTPRPSACAGRAVTGRRTRPGPPAGTGSARPGGAPRFRAATPATRCPSPRHRGTAGRSGRVSDRSADRRSSAAPGQSTTIALHPAGRSAGQPPNRVIERHWSRRTWTVRIGRCCRAAWPGATGGRRGPGRAGTVGGTAGWLIRSGSQPASENGCVRARGVIPGRGHSIWMDPWAATAPGLALGRPARRTPSHSRTCTEPRRAAPEPAFSESP